MKLYTKVEMDAFEKRFRSTSLMGVTTPAYKGTLTYFVMPASLNPELPRFALCVRGKTLEDGYLVGVSEAVHPDYRSFWALHEHYEFVVSNPRQPGRCVRALEWEVEQVPDGMKDEYLSDRHVFFKDLFAYQQRHVGEGSLTRRDVRETFDTVVRLANIISARKK